MELSGLLPSTSPKALSSHEAEKLRTASEKLEASFLAQMLKESGFGKTPDFAGGGEGESQFTSFLIDAQAEKIVEAGGIGLAEQIFKSLTERVDGIS
ncbi:rod-binding protein [Celeribacter sp.]|uniref:rod-binding protein n=1 Tax=Celeribacter sp. TaxID=1890673 RepID=UPI003A904D11